MFYIVKSNEVLSTHLKKEQNLGNKKLEKVEKLAPTDDLGLYFNF